MQTASGHVRRARRGTTLVELIVGMTILGIIGGALVRLLVVQGRFATSAEAYRASRSVSRDAYNIMMTDLRMVQDTLAIQKATMDTVTVRVPYAYGIVCGTTSGVTTVSLVPTDSALYSLATYGGLAYRDAATGVFQFFPRGAGTITPGAATLCTDSTLVGGVQMPGVTPLSYKGRAGKILAVTPNIGAAQAGNPMFLWQEITYAFGPSTAYGAGSRGLYRIVTNGPADEIIAPFDTSAHFRFYVLDNDNSQVTPPANLNSIRGLDLRLNARSPGATSVTLAKQTNAMTAVYFKDRRDP